MSNTNPFNDAATRSFQLGDAVDCGGGYGLVTRIEDGSVYAERDGNEWLVARLLRVAASGETPT